MTEDSEDHKEDTRIDWVIDNLVKLRKEYVKLDKETYYDLSKEERERASFQDSIQQKAILSQMQAFLSEYFLKETPAKGMELKFPRERYRWMDGYYYKYDSNTLSSNPDRVKKYWLENITNLAELVEGSLTERSMANQDEQYEKLKQEVEDLIEQYKTILVSDHFL
jgi:hypothetical protein